MKYELKNNGRSWWVKGMVVEGEINGRSEIIEVNSIDICELNKDIMTKEQIIECMRAPRYELDELEPLEQIKLTRLDYEMLKFVKKQGAKYICRDKGGLINLYEKEPYIMSHNCTWCVGGKCGYLGKFTEQLFQFVTWESQKYYVIKDVLENCEIEED